MSVRPYRVMRSALAFAALGAASASACPLCKEILFDPSHVQQRLAMAKAYALSIGLMLGVPVLLIAGVASLIVRSARHRHSIPK